MKSAHIERAELRWHRLRRTIKNDGIDFHEFQRRDQLQDRGTTARHVLIRQPGTQSQTIQRAKALRQD